MTTIDLIDVFFRQSIIGIDPIDVFLTIGAHLCLLLPCLQVSYGVLGTFFPQIGHEVKKPRGAEG
jgi:hypothetical protein